MAWTKQSLSAPARLLNQGWDRLRRLPFGVQLALLTLAALAVPLYDNNYVTAVGVSILTYAMLGIGLNIVMGYAGLLDLGYAAFFAIGAYTTAIMTVKFGLNFWVTLLPAMAFAGVAGLVLGFPTLRLRTDYLAIVTLGFGLIVDILFTNWGYVNGPNGIYGIPPPSILGWALDDESSFYVIALVLVLIALILSRNLVRSQLGREWAAVRDDEFAAEAVGVPTLRAKLLAYTLGGIWGGLAGAFFASRISAIDPTSFTFTVSSQIVILVVIGGLGSLPGVILGSIVVVAGPELLGGLQQSRFLVYAILLILMMLFRPQGLWPRRRGGPARFPLVTDDEALRAPDRVKPTAARGVSSGVVLNVDGVRKAFGGVTAVDRLSFRVHAGEILSIIGPNGAGKTSLFNCVTGVQTPDYGRIEFLGRSVTGLRPHVIVRRGIARTFQGIRLFNEMTVIENVMVGASVLSASRPWRAVFRTRAEVREERRAFDEARYWLSVLGIAHEADRLATELAYADQRRIEIARALASQPTLLLLDEPAAGMNPVEKIQLARVVRSIRDLGITVVIIDHDISLIMEVSDRVVVLDRGRMLAEGSPPDVRANPAVIDAYLGREDIEGEAERMPRGVRS